MWYWYCNPWCHLMTLTNSNIFFHECYVHDRIATGKFEHIQSLSSSLKKPGTSFGYQLTSCHLVVKPGLKEKAASFYEEDKIDFIDGHRVLRYFIVTSTLQNSFLEEKAIKHVSLLEKLPKHVKQRLRIYTSPSRMLSITNSISSLTQRQAPKIRSKKPKTS